MTDAMQTIRDKLVKIINNNVYHTLASRTFDNKLIDSRTIIRPDGKLAQEALTALDSLAVAPIEDAVEFIDTALSKSWDKKAQRYDRGILSDLIQARDERIRREVCDKLLGALESVPYSDKKREGASAYDDAIDVCLQTVNAKIAAILTPEAANDIQTPVE